MITIILLIGDGGCRISTKVDTVFE